MKDRENELQHHLELITNIAQRIDNENKSLMKKNQELKSEYKTQENDRELLVKQLVKQKKENAKIKEEIDFYERIIEEKEDEEDLDVDRIDTVSHAQNQFQQSRFTEPKGLYGRAKNHQRSQLGSRGGINRSQSNQQQQVPLVYIPSKKAETEEEKIKRYERVVEKLKKMLDHERKQLRQSRFAYQREMSQKTELEHLLREAVEQVKNERKQHRLQSATATSKFALQYAMGDNQENMDLSQQERERVIELLLSQERVIALLYEKTFPMTSVGNDKLNFGEQNINSTDNAENQGEVEDQQ